MYEATTILFTILPLALATPILHPLDPLPQRPAAPFTLIAARSGSPIHLQSINANNESFWIGKPTLSYCIPQVASCPPGTATAFTVGNDGSSDGACSLVSFSNSLAHSSVGIAF